METPFNDNLLENIILGVTHVMQAHNSQDILLLAMGSPMHSRTHQRSAFLSNSHYWNPLGLNSLLIKSIALVFTRDLASDGFHAIRA